MKKSSASLKISFIMVLWQHGTYNSSVLGKQSYSAKSHERMGGVQY